MLTQPRAGLFVGKLAVAVDLELDVHGNARVICAVVTGEISKVTAKMSYRAGLPIKRLIIGVCGAALITPATNVRSLGRVSKMTISVVEGGRGSSGVIRRRQGLACGSVEEGGGPFQVVRMIRYLRGPI